MLWTASYYQPRCRNAAGRLKHEQISSTSVFGLESVYFSNNKNALRVGIIDFECFEWQISVAVGGYTLSTISDFQCLERARVYHEWVWHKSWCSWVRPCERLSKENRKKKIIIILNMLTNRMQITNFSKEEVSFEELWSPKWRKLWKRQLGP